jgi:hypothetical protein
VHELTHEQLVAVLFVPLISGAIISQGINQ